MSQLLEVTEARQRLLDAFLPVGTEEMPVSQAVGRVLAQEIRTPFPLPSFANSSMDGFALHASDVQGASASQPVILPVVGDIPAGSNLPFRLESGQAARIMTGAPLPAGADAVVPVESTDFHDRAAGTPLPARVTVYKPVQPGDYVRGQGQDAQAGELVFAPGTRLRPQDLGFLSMLGIQRVQLYRRPRVAVFSSGDEILPPSQPLTPGKIYDANGLFLLSALQEAQVDTLDLGVFADRFEAIESGLQPAVEAGVDLILSSAGVSVGSFDFVRAVIEGRGALSFWRVNVRPGKPFAFGSYQQIPFIGLPGNPVSAFVGFELFVRPVLARLSGTLAEERRVQWVELTEAVESDGRQSYLRGEARLQAGRWTGRLVGHQGSGNLRSLVQANALFVIPAGVQSLPAGAQVEAWLL